MNTKSSLKTGVRGPRRKRSMPFVRGAEGMETIIFGLPIFAVGYFLGKLAAAL